MEGLLILIAIIALLGAFGLAAHVWGVDSRDGSVDPRRNADQKLITF